jgi:hypothetical protein
MRELRREVDDILFLIVKLPHFGFDAVPQLPPPPPPFANANPPPPAPVHPFISADSLLLLLPMLNPLAPPPPTLKWEDGLLDGK